MENEKVVTVMQHTCT